MKREEFLSRVDARKAEIEKRTGALERIRERVLRIEGTPSLTALVSLLKEIKAVLEGLNG